MVVSAGDFLPGATIVQGPKGTSAAIAKGDVVYLDTANHVWLTVPVAASQPGPFGVATLPAATTDTTVAVCIDGRVYVTAGGVIHPVHYVQNDTGTAGRVQEWVSDPSALGTAAINALRIIGQYEGHENEGTMASTQACTNTVATDVIRICLGTSG